MQMTFNYSFLMESANDIQKDVHDQTKRHYLDTDENKWLEKDDPYAA